MVLLEVQLRVVGVRKAGSLYMDYAITSFIKLGVI
jgi:hypothetical protein